MSQGGRAWGGAIIEGDRLFHLKGDRPSSLYFCTDDKDFLKLSV
ncbi:MAG: hypothetical protein VKL39_05305 [Leptolyngbyaceae bacterium]|nr:hypothetical protein [Leptolyngbyaceae bacterium]